MSLKFLLEPLTRVAREAGVAILRVYSTDFDVRRKADRSPVTDADMEAEEIIIAALSRRRPPLNRQRRQLASASGWSIRWMARANSSGATGSSRSISRWCMIGDPCSG